MITIIEELSNANKNILFGILCIFSILVTYLTSSVLMTENIYFNHFGEQMSYDQIKLFLDFQIKYQWVSYLILPVIYLFKLFLLTIVLLSGAIFWNINISFKKLFQIALIAEFLFIIPSLIKFFWFLFIETDFELTNLQTFYPLSLVNFIDVSDVPQWSLYPLQLVNIFEFAYWWILAYGISLVAKERWPKMLGLVASSYGVGLFVWVVFITFISINLS
jgi:hypothetical protein